MILVEGKESYDDAVGYVPISDCVFNMHSDHEITVKRKKVAA